MKCDVCQTNIPIGDDSCPNCGYKIRKEHVNIYDASGKTHNHIQTRSNYIKSRTKLSLDKPSNRNRKSIVKTVIILMCIAITLGFVTSVFVSLRNLMKGNHDYEVNKYEDLTYTEIVENGNDYDGTVEEALDYEKDLMDYLEMNDYQNVKVNETVNDSDYGLQTITYIESDKNNYHYTVIVSHQEMELTRVELTISGQFETPRKQLILSENDVKDIAEYIEIYSAYSIISSSYAKMEKSGNEYKYSDYTGDTNIYMSERYYDVKKPYYSFYYSVSEDLY